MLEQEITPHPEEQRSLAELRSEFRAENLQRIRDSITGKHPVGWSMSGDPLYARDKYTAEEWAYLMHHRLSERVEQDFGLGDVPFTSSIKLEEQAQAAALHDSVTWDDQVEGVSDHDAPPCAPVAAMSDDELCDYVDRAIKESENV